MLHERDHLLHTRATYFAKGTIYFHKGETLLYTRNIYSTKGPSTSYTKLLHKGGHLLYTGDNLLQKVGTYLSRMGRGLNYSPLQGASGFSKVRSIYFFAKICIKHFHTHTKIDINTQYLFVFSFFTEPFSSTSSYMRPLSSADASDTYMALV